MQSTSYQQFEVLERLRLHGGLLQREVAEMLGISEESYSRIAKKLRQKGKHTLSYDLDIAVQAAVSHLQRVLKINLLQIPSLSELDASSRQHPQ